MNKKQVECGVAILTFKGSGNIVHEAPYYDKLDWPATVQFTKVAEELGYDSAWVVDHLMLGKDNAIFECWTALSYLAAVTNKIRLGPFVLCNSYRNPALVAKMASTFDIISNGRLSLGIGAGWHSEEYIAYGYRFPPPRERVEALRESLIILRKMLSEPPTSSFTGKYSTIENAVNNPQPMQRPCPPIMVGAYGDRMLQLIAELADGWCVSGLPGDPSDASPDVFRERSEYLDSCCEKVGRDPDHIDRIWTGHVIIAHNRETAEKRIAFTREKISQEVDSGRMLKVDPDAMIETFIHGTPTQCVSQLMELRKAGANNFVLYFDDFPKTESIELFSKQVWKKIT